MYRDRLHMDEADVCTGIGYIWMRPMYVQE